MPKLNTDVLIQRLQGRIAELEAGDEVANKHIRALLTDAQQQALDDALAEQVELKKVKRARTEEEKDALGWKTIREVRLEVLAAALAEASAGLLADYKQRIRATDVRQARIYFEAYGKARDEGKDIDAAKTWANNELTRADLRRMDGMSVGHQSKRDREVNEMEDAIRAQIKSEMTEDELEQQQMLEDLERNRKSVKSSGADKVKK
jgi:hypothetical protein